jgi:hypothetical protein
MADVATTPAAATAEAALAKNERRPASGNELQVQCFITPLVFYEMIEQQMPGYRGRVNKACAMRVKLAEGCHQSIHRCRRGRRVMS